MISPRIRAWFDEPRVITAIQTQGAGANGAFVRHYQIEIRGVNSWAYIKNDEGANFVFDGSMDGNTVVTNW